MQGEIDQVKSKTELIEKQIEEATPGKPDTLPSIEPPSFVRDDGTFDWSIFEELSKLPETRHCRADFNRQNMIYGLALHGMTSQQHSQALEELADQKLSDSVARRLEIHFRTELASEAPLETLKNFDGS